MICLSNESFERKANLDMLVNANVDGIILISKES